MTISSDKKEPKLFYLDEKPFALPANPRFIALLLALYNSNLFKEGRITIKRDGYDSTFERTLKFTLDH